MDKNLLPQSQVRGRTAASLVMLLLALCVTTSAPAAIVIKFDDIEGESDFDNYRGWNVVDSLQWPITATVSEGTGGTGRGITTLDVGHLSWEQELDSSYPELFSNIVTGKVLATVDVAFFETDGKGRTQPYFTMAFEDVSLRKLSLSGDANNRPRFDGEFDFRTVEVEYFNLLEGGSESASWDRQSGVSAGTALAAVFALGLAGPATAPVPLPAAVWLLLPGLGVLLRRRRV